MCTATKRSKLLDQLSVQPSVQPSIQPSILGLALHVDSQHGCTKGWTRDETITLLAQHFLIVALELGNQVVYMFLLHERNDTPSKATSRDSRTIDTGMLLTNIDQKVDFVTRHFK